MRLKNSFLLNKLILIILGSYLLLALDNDHDPDTFPTVIDSARQLASVPERLIISSNSIPEMGKHTYTVNRTDPSESVYGPVSTAEVFTDTVFTFYPLADIEGSVQEMTGDHAMSLEVSSDHAESVTSVTPYLTGEVAVQEESDPCDVSCGSDDDLHVACVLDDACTEIDVVDNIFTPANAFNSNISFDNTVIWLQAFGGQGGSGGRESGNSATAASGGMGGYAQVVYSSLAQLGTGTLSYLIGKSGKHDDVITAGSGGAATLIGKNDELDDLDTLYAIAGGGGGGGYRMDDAHRSNGGNGGIAISTSSSVGNGAGSNAGHVSGNHNGKGANTDGLGGGGEAGEGASGYKAADGQDGIGGKGGDIAGEDTICFSAIVIKIAPIKLTGWLTAGSQVREDNTAGQGGRGGINSAGVCWGGAGGGGYGGGGGGTAYEEDYWIIPSIVVSGEGGGGGGSWAAQGDFDDPDAPTEYPTSTHSGTGNGEIVITFDLAAKNDQPLTSY